MQADVNDKEITVEWEETTHCKATLTAEEARLRFGLGGTPDGNLAWRISTLALGSGEELAVLGDLVQSDELQARKLLRINGVLPADL